MVFLANLNLYYMTLLGSEWHMHNNGKPVPVYVEIDATGKFGGHTERKLSMRYDFFNFKRDYKPSLYEVEVSCYIL